jgi:hypothetical protein
MPRRLTHIERSILIRALHAWAQQFDGLAAPASVTRDIFREQARIARQLADGIMAASYVAFGPEVKGK